MINKTSKCLPVGGVVVEANSPHRVYMISSSSVDGAVLDRMSKIHDEPPGLLNQQCCHVDNLLKIFVPMNFVTAPDTAVPGKSRFSDYLVPFTEKSVSVLVGRNFNFDRFFKMHTQFALNKYDVAHSASTLGQQDHVCVIGFKPDKLIRRSKVTFRYEIDHFTGYKKNIFRALMGKFILNEVFDRKKEYVYMEMDVDLFLQHYYPKNK